MRYEAEIQNILIENAIHTVARGGFERASTKELTNCGGNPPDFKMNEVYIYRFFGSKEKLFESAFLRLSDELYRTFQRGLEMVEGHEGYTRERLNEFFLIAWNFILGDEERCRYFVRYYYSVYFKGYSAESHERNFQKIAEKLAPLFKEEANVLAILHSVYTAMLDFAIRVYNGNLENDEQNTPYIFNMLYGMLSIWFKDSLKDN